jgi:hypothetical protein
MNLPGAHSSQIVFAFSFCALPTAQSSHAVVAFTSEKRPATHDVHVDRPGRFMNLPLTQSRHSDCALLT